MHKGGMSGKGGGGMIEKRKALKKKGGLGRV
jgi:hypothetical protein